MEGYRHAMARAGLAAEPDPNETELGGDEEHFAERFLERFAEATAVVCTTAAMAREVIAAAEAAGRRVPEDLSVLSAQPGAMREGDPRARLTAVDPRWEAVMEKSLDLIEEIRETGRYGVTRVCVTPSLIEGDSLGPPRERRGNRAGEGRTRGEGSDGCRGAEAEPSSLQT
jgi:DNA-binding LacI/PurR family transcriptional regulator